MKCANPKCFIMLSACICVIETFIKIELSFQKFLWCSSSVLSLQANVFLAFSIIDSFCLFSNFIGIHIHTNDKVYALCIRLLEFSIIITRLILPVCVSSFFYIGGGISCVYSIFLLTVSGQFPDLSNYE